MQNLSSFIVLFFLSTLSGFSQNSTIYSKVEVVLNETTTVQTLADAGIGIDHVHKHGDGVEFILNGVELELLKNTQIPFEILVPDMTAQYLDHLQKAEGNLVAMDCGLEHFDEGSMGGYHTYDDLQNHINLMQTEFPNLVKVTEIGKSLEDRSVFSVKISDNVATDESNSEGVVYYDAITHAREPMGLETHLYYMWWLLENYGTDAEATYLIDNREIYFVPIVNPDGYVFNQTNNPSGGGYWRKNRRDNGDGSFGVDLNRNYSFHWGEPWGSSSNPGSDLYHGESAFSEPESQNVRDFVASIRPAISFSCHTYTDVMISPEDFAEDLPKKEIYYDFASEFMPEEYKAYGPAQDLIGYSAAGTTQDYLHSEGIYSYTPEIGHSFWEFPENICDRVQEMFIPMKYLSWVSGDYATLNSYELIHTGQLWRGDELDLMVQVKNKGLSTTSQEILISATSSSSKISFLEDEVKINNLAPRETKGNTLPLRFRLDGDFEPGEEIPITLTIMQDGMVSTKRQLIFSAGVQMELFSEDCELDTEQWIIEGDAWATTTMDAYGGVQAMSDSPTGNYLREVSGSLAFKNPIDLSLTENPFFEFKAKWSLEGQNDIVQLQTSIDNGGSWVDLIGDYTLSLPGFTSGYTHTKHWVQERIDLKAFIGQELLIRFVFNSDYGLQGDGFYFDDLRVMDYTEGTSVSTFNPSPKNQIYLFPNPNTGEAQLNWNRISPTDAMVSISDLSGRVITTKEFQLKQGYNTEFLHFSENGFYIVKVEMKDGSKEVFRVVTVEK